MTEITLAANQLQSLPKAPPKLVPANSGGRSHCRLAALGGVSPDARRRTEELVALAIRGLPQMYAQGAFAHTVRALHGGNGEAVRPEGDSLRYAINVALGLSFVSLDEQRKTLSGKTAADLVRSTVARAQTSNDLGAIALAAWTAAEATGIYATPLFHRLRAFVASDMPLATVDCAWMLLAATAGRLLGDTASLTVAVRDRLLQAQSASGLFPHRLPASSSGRLRAHIGCFADQVYAIQGLSRLCVATGDTTALAAANACADRICALQGPSGQWWWHYDIRNGGVVERYPVYSVHQHAMGPMALLDLREAGGHDHLGAVIRGLRWLDQHPEVSDPVVSDAHNVIWRKAARREPKKAVRAIAAFTTALKPGLQLPGLDNLFPPNRVDYECRPYELGWLLYAWLSGGTVQRLAEHAVNVPAQL